MMLFLCLPEVATMRPVARLKNTLFISAISLGLALAAPVASLAASAGDPPDGDAATLQFTEATPGWSFTGVSLSASSVTSGEPVTVTPQVTGDLDGASYNYVWSYGGGWDLWGSTVRDTGKGTSDAEGTLTLTRPGTYTVYVDVTDRSGQKRTMSATLEVTPPSWSFTGVELSASRVTSGEPVTVTPVTSGDLDGATYNYVWSYGGGWDLWGSTARDTGKGTSEATGTLALTKPGDYTVYVDVTDRAGERRTMSAQLVVSSPSWTFTGVKVSPSRVRVDEPVTVTPVTSGDLDGAEYNYVWSYGGGWDLWDSTVKDEGKPTADATGTLSFYRPGRYVLYVDVTDRSGQTRTMSSEVEAYDDSWSLDGVTATPAEVVAGDEVTYEPVVSGDASGLRYNYVWQRDGSWAEGDWGSTELDEGSDTDEASHKGALGTPGRYTLYVDAVSARGERRTASAQVVAWGVTGIDVSSSDGGMTWKASADLFEVPSDAQMEYRFRWEASDGSASGTLSDWSAASSCTFRRSDFGSLASRYRIYLDVKYPNGKTSAYASDSLSLLSDSQMRVIASAYNTPSVGSGYCSEWVDNVFVNVGFYRYGQDKDANDLCREFCTYTKLSDLQPGMIVAVEKSPTPLGRIYGHVAVYIGDGKLHDDEGYIREMSLTDWLAFYSKLDTPRWGWYGNIPLA
jgi:hypothetical protein